MNTMKKASILIAMSLVTIAFTATGTDYKPPPKEPSLTKYDIVMKEAPAFVEITKYHAYTDISPVSVQESTVVAAPEADLYSHAIFIAEPVSGITRRYGERPWLQKANYRNAPNSPPSYTNKKLNGNHYSRLGNSKAYMRV